MLQKKLIERTGDPELKLDVSFMMRDIDGKLGVETAKPQPLRFSYRKKKKTGEFYTKLTKSFVSFSFCPFCGREYDEL
jgi:hypothetical protein